MKTIIILISLSILLIACGINKQTVKENAVPVSLSKDIVVIYSTSWCYWCKIAKQFLVDNNIEYVEKDLENEKHHEELKEIAKSIGYKGNLNVVPLFVVKNTIIPGYQPLEILNLLGRKKGTMKIFGTPNTYDKINSFKGSNIFK